MPTRRCCANISAVIFAAAPAMCRSWRLPSTPPGDCGSKPMLDPIRQNHSLSPLLPAKAGIQGRELQRLLLWIPACAGMSGTRFRSENVMSFEHPKVVVVGAGAMGGLFGGLLAEGGLDVTLVDAWPEHIAAIRQKGLRIVGVGGDRDIKSKAPNDAARIRSRDVVPF